MKQEKLIYKKVDELIPYVNNPRQNDNAVDAVASSIKNFGFKVPIVIDSKNEIINGHTRIKAAIKLGLKEVPCIDGSDLNEQQVKAFRLADNKVSELATWDDELLNLELLGLQDFDMSEFGFDLSELDNYDFTEEDVQDDGFDLEENIQEKPDVKRGQIYQLGNHRLMCGDSTNQEDVKKLVGNNEIDLVVTDPPYNVAYSEKDYGRTKASKTREYNEIENDQMSNNVFYNFLLKAFKNIFEVLKPGGAFYIWYASREVVNFSTALKEAGLTVKQELVWNKNVLVLGRQDYQWKHEPCLYGWKEGASHYFTDSRTETTVFEDEMFNYRSLKKEELIKLLDDIFSDKISTTIINEAKPARNDLHPTMKPIKLMARQILNSSKQEEKVLDLFAGSGSTLIACEQTNRHSFNMEYDPKYADAIIKRWEQFTGEKAKLIQN